MFGLQLHESVQPAGYDCVGGFGILGDLNCDGFYEVCLMCPPGTEPIDSNGDGCEDTCGCCPTLECPPGTTPINNDADSCMDGCFGPGAGLCEFGITGYCPSANFGGECNATCAVNEIPTDNCDGAFEGCQPCPQGTHPVDTTGNGCVDSCDCCYPMECPKGYAPFDVDGDGCADDTCAPLLPKPCADGETGMCFGYYYVAQCDAVACGDSAVPNDGDCDGIYESCLPCAPGTEPVDTTGDGCPDTCDCPEGCPEIYCPVFAVPFDSSGDGCPDSCKKKDKLDCCTSKFDDVCLTFGDINKGGGEADVVDVQCAILTTLFKLEGEGAIKPSCLGDEPVNDTDVNCDGNTSVSDILLVVQSALKIPMNAGLDKDGTGCVDVCEYEPDCEELVCKPGEIGMDTDQDQCVDTCRPCDGFTCLDGVPIDLDKDGCPDTCDVCEPVECEKGIAPVDVDKDGCPDQCVACSDVPKCDANTQAIDLDKDGCADTCSACPETPVCNDVEVAVDSDKDGCPDSCSK